MHAKSPTKCRVDTIANDSLRSLIEHYPRVLTFNKKKEECVVYKVVDLFAGAGGLSLGFMQTRKYDIKVAFENSPYMQETYRLNHPALKYREMSALQIMTRLRKNMGI